MNSVINEIIEELGKKNFSDILHLRTMLINSLTSFAYEGSESAHKTLRKVKEKSMVEQVAWIYHDFPDLRELGENVSKKTS
ncbi:hypothetical protein ACFVS2_20850 [Brevibacillus sp. NPDC058079]|uniref:hypothetical protein n=1 Tax=Brevibacillus sp. NPDC058079 TaxID=3346330 RepID=UPI0036EED6E5